MPYSSGADWLVEIVGSGGGAVGVEGTTADGAAFTGKPVVTAGVDGGGLVQTHLVDTEGRHVVVGAVAQGAAVAGNPVLMGGTFGGFARAIAVDTAGRPSVVGAAADGAPAAGNPLLMAGMDGSGNTQSLLTDTSGRPLVAGQTAHGTAIAGNPVRIGGRVLSSGNQVDIYADTPNTTHSQTSRFALHTIASNYWLGSVDWEQAKTAPAAAGLTGTGVPAAGPLLFDETNFQLERANTQGTVLASAARTATNDSADQTNHNARGVRLTINVSSITTAPSITVAVDEKDPISGGYSNILTSAAITTVSRTVLTIYPGATVTANLTASMPLSRTWRVTVTHANADSISYSVAFAYVL